MPIKLMYITNNPQVALIGEQCGVDRLWVDMEWMGKDERQPGDTVKSHHTLDDITKLRKVLMKSQLMARVNPLHDGSKEEIRESIDRGAEIVMLPMWKTTDDVKRFIDYVDGRAIVNLLLETKEALENIYQIVKIPGIDEVHIGLNDLHLSLHKKFMFELLSDGTVEHLCNVLRNNHIRYGFGGIGRIGDGTLPAEYILAEHVRLGSSMVILSRSFCNTSQVSDWNALEISFRNGVHDLRLAEKLYRQIGVVGLGQLHLNEMECVDSIISGK